MTCVTMYVSKGLLGELLRAIPAPVSLLERLSETLRAPYGVLGLYYISVY